MIERILKEEEMPDDLKYLALQESALIPDAVSSSNAVGFWQFKKETAEDYGLTVNDKIDERKNMYHQLEQHLDILRIVTFFLRIGFFLFTHIIRV